MDGLLADHARDLTLAGRQDHALADENLRIPASDLAEPEEALVVDVGDDQADLVDVPHHHQAPCLLIPATCRDTRRRRAHDICARLRAERCGRVAPHRGRGVILAGRAARRQQVAQDDWEAVSPPPRTLTRVLTHDASNPRSTYW